MDLQGILQAAFVDELEKQAKFIKLPKYVMSLLGIPAVGASAALMRDPSVGKKGAKGLHARSPAGMAYQAAQTPEAMNALSTAARKGTPDTLHDIL